MPGRRSLKFPSRPATITRLVVAVRVDSIDGQAFRARPHIRDEREEIVAPSVADHDALRAIEPVVAGRGDVTPGLHAAPDCVLPFVISSRDNGAVLGVPTSAHGPLCAPAAGRVTAEQVLPVLRDRGPAVTPALPMRTSVLGRRAMNHRQLAEPLAGQVFCGCEHAVDDTAAAITVQVEKRAAL